MIDQELIARLQVAPGDFVTLDHEQAKRCAEALARENSVAVRNERWCLLCGEMHSADAPPCPRMHVT